MTDNPGTLHCGLWKYFVGGRWTHLKLLQEKAWPRRVEIEMAYLIFMVPPQATSRVIMSDPRNVWPVVGSGPEWPRVTLPLNKASDGLSGRAFTHIHVQTHAVWK